MGGGAGQEGTPFPLGRGLSQAKIDVATGKITRVVDIAEVSGRGGAVRDLSSAMFNIGNSIKQRSPSHAHTHHPWRQAPWRVIGLLLTPVVSILLVLGEFKMGGVV